MKIKKIGILFLIAIAVTALIVLVVACKSAVPAEEEAAEKLAEEVTEEPAEEEPTEAVQPVKIGVSMATTQNLFFSKMVKIIEERCEELGVEVIVSDENNDLSKQISSVENFITSGCTAMIIVAFDPEGINDAVKVAVDEGIYVMTYDGKVDSAQGFCMIDNYEYGYTTGKMAADWVNNNPELKAQEVIEAGIFDYPDIHSIIDRAIGIGDALMEAPNVEIVAQQKAGVGDEGVIQGENFLQAHPNMQIICGINDTGILGAYEAWSSVGNVGDNIGFFGADGDPQALKLIAQGTIVRGTTVPTILETLHQMVDTVVKASRGEDVNDEVPFSMVPVTIENVQDYLENGY